MNRDKFLGSCFGKASYASHREAKRVIERVLRRKSRKPAWCNHAKLVAYRCRACDHYHVGNDGKAGSNGY